MSCLRVFFILSIFLTASCQNGNPQPKAVKGILDLREHDFAKNPIIPLDGEWEFYWKKFCNKKFSEPGNFCGTHKPGYIKVPGLWEDFKGQTDETLNTKGYATYRLRILLGKTSQLLAIKTPYIESAYEFWIGDTRIAKGGKIAAQKEYEEKAYNIQVVSLENIFSKSSQDQAIDLLLKVSNFHHSRSGIFRNVELGIHESLQKEYTTTLLRDYLLFGAILIMGLYHIGLYSLRRKDKSTLCICFLFFSNTSTPSILLYTTTYIYSNLYFCRRHIWDI